MPKINKDSAKANADVEMSDDSDVYYPIRGILQETKRRYLFDWEDGPLGEVYKPSWGRKSNATAQAVADWKQQMQQRCASEVSNVKVLSTATLAQQQTPEAKHNLLSFQNPSIAAGIRTEPATLRLGTLFDTRKATADLGPGYTNHRSDTLQGRGSSKEWSANPATSLSWTGFSLPVAVEHLQSVDNLNNTQLAPDTYDRQMFEDGSLYSSPEAALGWGCPFFLQCACACGGRHDTLDSQHRRQLSR